MLNGQSTVVVWLGLLRCYNRAKVKLISFVKITWLFGKIDRCPKIAMTSRWSEQFWPFSYISEFGTFKFKQNPIVLQIVDKCLMDGADEYLQLMDLCTVIMQQACRAN